MAGLVFLSVFENIYYFWKQMQMAKVALQEGIHSACHLRRPVWLGMHPCRTCACREIECIACAGAEDLDSTRYELRIKILQQSAFNDLFPYRPRVLMDQLSESLKACKEDRTHQIRRLNLLGSKIPLIHHQFQQFKSTNMGQEKSSSMTDKAMAVIDVLSTVAKLEELQLLKDILDAGNGASTAHGMAAVWLGGPPGRTLCNHLAEVPTSHQCVCLVRRPIERDRDREDQEWVRSEQAADAGGGGARWLVAGGRCYLQGGGGARLPLLHQLPACAPPQDPGRGGDACDLLGRLARDGHRQPRVLPRHLRHAVRAGPG
eukprot:COSAG01_NODE_5194_length_4419_cov_6.478752_6_plen_317_part_00